MFPATSRGADWLSNEGESQALDFFINKCRHDITNLRVKPVRRFNLPHEERRAMTDLKADLTSSLNQRKPAEKGGAV